MRVQNVNFSYYGGRVSSTPRIDNPRMLKTEAENGGTSKPDAAYIHSGFSRDISFGAAHAGNLINLCKRKYGLSCMYSGVTLIHPHEINRIKTSGILAEDSVEALGELGKFAKRSMFTMERSVFDELQKQSRQYPREDLGQIMQRLKPKYIAKLKQLQTSVFDELRSKAMDLPPDNKSIFDELMSRADNMVNEIPFYRPFSRKEFAYRLEKLLPDEAAKGNIQKLAQMCRNAPSYKEPRAQETQRAMVKTIKANIGRMIAEKRIQNSHPLQSLFAEAFDRINKKERVIRFNRKSFIYDLGQEMDISGLDNKELKNDLINIARKLPTSNEEISAYIVKNADEDAEKIGLRLILPSMGTIEHIIPRSKGGADALHNYGIVSMKWNSEMRGNTDFPEFLRIYPKAKHHIKHFFKQLESLIKHHRGKLLQNLKLPQDYITNLKKTIRQAAGNGTAIDI